MMRRSVLGALLGSVALVLAGVGGAVAIQRAHSPAAREEAVQVVGGNAPSEVAQPSTTSVATTSVPTTVAPAPATTTTIKPRSVGTTVPVSVASPLRSTIPPRPSRPSGSVVTLPRVTPTTVPFVANMRHCTATPSRLELAYNQWAPVHISFNVDAYAGSSVSIRDGGPVPYSVPSAYGYAPVDATGRGADFLLGVAQPWIINGVSEPTGTPHTFYLDEWDCSVTVIPH